MELISSFVREQKRYTKNDLKSIFSFDELSVERFIKNLKAFGVLKSVKNNAEQLEMSELIDEDVEITDETAESGDCLYVFTYVGLITCGMRVVKVYPKYLLSVENDPVSEMKQVLRVLEKYSRSDEQIINIFNGNGEDRSFNILAVILFLINDYYEYGIYTNTEDIIDVNGEGEILWQKTIDESFALIEDNRPYYTELFTKKTVDDNADYFKRLHELVLTDCSNQLDTSHLNELFDMDRIELSEETVDELGGRDYILDRIHKELNVQFNTRKQRLLKTLYAYISQDKRLLEEDDGISMFGTTSFHSVWEKVCADAFDNKLNTPIKKLPWPNGLSEKYNNDRSKTLLEIIEKPLWENEDVSLPAKDTLIPDLISVYRKDERTRFIILDAKYYNLQLEKGKSLRGNPGVGDVTKQYLYQLAYRNLTEDNGIASEDIKNYFIMPTEKSKMIKTGVVKMKMLESLGLHNIEIRQLPANLIFDCYLSGNKYDVDKLE